MNYYNELEPYAAQWLKNLSDAGHIARGRVDSRSITEVTGDDVKGCTQAHFFAGIGVWSYALRLARWPDDAPVWTGSCPCQPFSNAGLGRGFDDERHLWPEWLRLIRECRPPILFGEQVASADGRAWLTSLRADLEALGYVVGAADLCAAGVGAPHIRQRLYFGGVLPAYAGSVRVRRQRPAEGTGGVQPWGTFGPVDMRTLLDRPFSDGAGHPQPLIRSMVDGTPNRVGRVRAYGNAIVPQVAANFVRSFVEALS